MANDLVLQLLLETSDAEKQVKDFTSSASSDIDKMAKSSEPSLAVTQKAAAKAKQSVAAIGKAALIVGGAVGVTAVAVTGLAAALGDAQGRMDLIALSKVWQVQASSVENYRSTLNDVKTDMEALASVLELKQIGFDSEDISRLATMTNIISATTGEAKDTIETRLKSARVTERDLGVFTKLTGVLKTQAGVQLAISRATLAAGGATLTLADRAKAVNTYLAGTAAAAKKLEANLGAIGTANPFDVFGKQLKTIREEFVTFIAPSLLSTFSSVTNFIRKMGQGTAVSFLLIRNGWTETRKILRDMRRDEALLAVRSQTKAKKDIKKIQAMNAQAHSKRLEHLKEQKRASESVQEALGRQSRARALRRNFERVALQKIAAFGAKGISGTISGISKLIELSKVLGSNMEGSSKSARLMRLQLEAGSIKAKQLALSEQAKTNSLKASLSLSKEVRAEAKASTNLSSIEMGLSGGIRAATAAILVLERSKNSVSQSGADTLRNTLTTLRSISKERRKIVLLTLEKARAEASLGKASKALTQQAKMNSLLTQQAQLRKIIRTLGGETLQDTGRDALATAVNSQIELTQIAAKIKLFKRLKKTVLDARDSQKLDLQIKQHKDIATELNARQRLEIDLVHATARRAKFAKEIADKAIKDTAAKTLASQVSLQNKLAEIRAKLQGKPGATPTEGPLAQTIVQIKQLSTDLESLGQQQKQLTSGTTQAIALQAVITAKTTELGLTREIAAEQAKAVAKEKERLTVIGSIAYTMQAQVQGLSQRLGNLIAKDIVGMATGMITVLGTLFSDLVTNPAEALDNLGKSVLNSFGDMALQLAGFFAAEAIGMAFTPGGQGAAVGLSIAAGALATIGGTLKGVASTIGATPKPSAASGVSTGGNRAGIPGTSPRTPEAVSETFILINDVPWRKRGQAADYSEMIGYIKKGGRMTGQKIQMEGR